MPTNNDPNVWAGVQYCQLGLAYDDRIHTCNYLILLIMIQMCEQVYCQLGLAYDDCIHTCNWPDPTNDPNVWAGVLSAWPGL
jgi:hypothetical protein